MATNDAAWDPPWHSGLRALDRVRVQVPIRYGPQGPPSSNRGMNPGMPQANVEWRTVEGVVHRVHHENNENTVTIQFPRRIGKQPTGLEQHRIRVPIDSVTKIQDFEPVYPTVRIHPGANIPTAQEVQLMEAEQQRAAHMGLPRPPMPPGFALEDPRLLHQKHVVREQRWGIAEPTLDALRNRSIPAYDVTGRYGRHFYSGLYENNFYPSRGHLVQDTGMVEGADSEVSDLTAGNKYYPLFGPGLELQEDGSWRPMKEPYSKQVEL